MMNKVNLTQLIFLVLFLSACTNETQIIVNFSENQTVKKGDDIKFKEKVIGEVGEITPSQPGISVVLKVKEDKVNLINSNSAAIVVEKPQRHVQLHSNREGDALEPGSRIRGLNNPVELATWSAGTALGSLEGLMTSATNAFNQFLNENNWEEIANQLNQSLEQLNDQSSGVLNQFGDELEDIISSLQNDTADSLHKAEELSKTLEKELETLKNQGQDNIAKAVENMLYALKSILNEKNNSGDSDKGEPL